MKLVPRWDRIATSTLGSLAIVLGVSIGWVGCSEEAGNAVDGATPDATWTDLETADQNWQVRWRPIPSEIPALEPFSVEVMVNDAGGRPAGDGVSVVVDATMPHHGHGMNVIPRVTRDGDRWLAEGLLLHMPGRWEFTIDVVRADEVERAQWTEELES